MLRKPLVSILVPAFNEEEIIDKFLKEFLKLIKGFDRWELVIVENGSTDKTAQIINEFIKKNKSASIILRQLSKPGYGKAIIEAFKYARGKYTVFFNVDFWDKRFIDLCKVDLLGYDVIGSSKLLKNSKDLRPWSRKLITRFYSLFLQIFLGFEGTDTHGLKVFRTDVVLPLVKRCKTTSGIFDSELVLRCQRNRLRYMELPVEVKEIRESRFNLDRFITTPKDIYQLYKALR